MPYYGTMEMSLHCCGEGANDGAECAASSAGETLMSLQPQRATAGPDLRRGPVAAPV